MKRLLILLLIMLLLGGAAYYLKKKEDVKPQKTSLDIADRQFAVKDIKQVDKITVQKGIEDGFLIERDDNNVWWLNNQHEINRGALDYLLQTIANIEIHSIPPATMLPTIEEDLSRVGIKVKLYNEDGELIKSYVVGTQAPGGKATTMIMDGYSQPYFVFMKGFEGNLRLRYFVDPIKWRSRRVFEAKKDEIEYVDVKYNRKNSESFRIANDGNGFKISRTSAFVDEDQSPIDQVEVLDYLGGYQKLYAEGFESGNPKKDSIKDLIPFATVTLKKYKADPLTVRFHSVTETLHDGAHLKQVEDAAQIERYFADVSNDDFMLVQGRVFNTIFRPYSYFLED